MSTLRSPWFWVSCAALPVAWNIAGAVIHRLAKRRTTVLNELETLGTSRKDGKLSGIAVIAGGSFAGLIAARVLSDHYESVVVVEPDTELTDKRSRVGQWNQGHTFMSIILVVLRRLFKNFDDEVKQAGLKLAPTAGQLQFNGRTMLTPQDRIAHTIVSSRMGLESLVRRLIQRTCPSVKFVQGTVTGVTASADASRIASAQIRTTDSERDIALAFFVDCTGPTCSAARWLPRAHPSWGPIARDTYDPKVSYMSTIVPIPRELADKFDLGYSWEERAWIRVVNPSWKAADTRMYGIGRLEGDRMLLGTCHWGGSGEGLDSIASYLEFCKSVEAAVSEEEPPFAVYDVIQAIQAAYSDADKEPRWSRHKVNGGLHHMRYDAARALPANFAALGDAFMRVNPIFGQGCGKCVMDGATLDGALRQGRVIVDGSASRTVHAGFSIGMAKTQSLRLRPLFDSTRYIDYSFPETQPMEGETLGTGHMTRLYLRALISLCHDDEDIAVKYWNVMGQIDPGTVLMHPVTLARLFWRALCM